MVNGQWWKFDYFTVAVVGLLTNNRSWRHAYPLLKLYCLNASHVGQKTNMGFGWLSDLVNGGLVNGQWWMVRTSCCFKTIMLIHPAHYQFSVINYPFSDALLNSHPSPPQPAGLRNCNAAAFASFWKFAAPFSKYRLRRYRSKRGGLCNYWWKCENRLEIFFMPLLVYWPRTEVDGMLTHC